MIKQAILPPPHFTENWGNVGQVFSHNYQEGLKSYLGNRTIFFQTAKKKKLFIVIETNNKHNFVQKAAKQYIFN